MVKKSLLKSGRFWLGLFFVLALFTFYLQNRGAHNIDSISISEEAYKAMMAKYVSQDAEFIICGYGFINGKTALVTRVYEPLTFSSSPSDAAFKACSLGGALGTIHKHPEGACSLSAQDLVTFGKLGHDFMGIMCSPDKIFAISQFGLRPLEVKIRS